MGYLIYLVQEKEQLDAFPIYTEKQVSDIDFSDEKTATEIKEFNLITKESTQTITSISQNIPSITKQFKSSEISLEKKSSDKKIVAEYDFISTTEKKQEERQQIAAITTVAQSTKVHQVQTLEPLSSSTDLLISQVDNNINAADLKIEYAAFKPYYSLEIRGGTNSWTSNYNTTLLEQDTRAKSETELWGYQLAANAKYHFKPNWFATTGLEFQQLNHRFNYNSVKIEQVEQRNTLVGITINSISGDSTFIRENVTVDVETKRSVQHYNQHQLLSIPMYLGYQWNQNRLTLGGSIGGIFSIHSISKGKTISDSEIILYNRENPIYKKRFGMGISTNVQLNYALTNKIYIGGTLSYTNWLNNWSVEQNVESKPNIRQFSLLFGKKF
ncbi:MAG: hypothetical protein AAFP82_18535 [Bacteroidota bacterium]